MRITWSGSALALVLSLGAAQAQNAASAPQPQPAPDAAAATEAQSTLKQLADRLRTAPQSGPELDQTKQATRDALQQLAPSVGTLPQARQQEVKTALDQAEQSLSGNDPRQMAEAIDRMQLQMAGGEPAGAGQGAEAAPRMAQQPASAAERETPGAVPPAAPQQAVKEPPKAAAGLQTAKQAQTAPAPPAKPTSQQAENVAPQAAPTQGTAPASGQPAMQAAKSAEPKPAPAQAQNAPAQQQQPQGATQQAQNAPPAKPKSKQAETPTSPFAGMTPNDIAGKTLRSAASEDIGTVKDVVQARKGEFVAIVVGVGGFLGIGQHEAAIPLRDVDLEGDRITTRLTSDQVAAMPEFNKNDYQPIRLESGAGRPRQSLIRAYREMDAHRMQQPLVRRSADTRFKRLVLPALVARALPATVRARFVVSAVSILVALVSPALLLLRRVHIFDMVMAIRTSGGQ